MKRCSNCILPVSYPGIVFDADRVCNYCGDFAKSPLRGSEEDLRHLLAPFRDRGDYDCIVALSGGRDSTYVAHYAAKKLDLRVLAVTCDNGFMPQRARVNASRAVERLGIDHECLAYQNVQNHAGRFISAWIKNPSPAMIAFLCNGCMTGIRKLLTDAARRHGVSVILGGGGGVVGQGGEPEQSFAEKLLSTSTSEGRLGHRWGMITGFLTELARNPAYLQWTSLDSFAREFLHRFWYGYDRNLLVLGLFEFVSWSEDEVVSTIQSELRWEKPTYRQTSWRADCKIHFLKDYLYGATLGFTKNVELLSGMIREGMLTRDEALERLKRDDYLSAQFLDRFVSELGIQLHELERALADYRERPVRHALRERAD
ncbi:MAG: asparagine synthase-related protein [Anaerolineae bacterium]